MTIASNSHPGPTDNLPGKASHRQPTASNAITAGHRGSRVCGSIILVTAIFRTGIKLDRPTPGKDKRPKDPSLRMPRPPIHRITKIRGEALKFQALRAGEILRLSPSSGVIAIVQVHCCPQPHPAHNCHEILPEAESSIRRQYRFGSCRRKQQSTRDGCGEALLDTERGEMVRSQRGTVA